MTQILNQTTKVPAERTAQEIQLLLQKHRARSVAVSYDDAGLVTDIAFLIATKHGERAFRLPARIEGVYRVLYQGVPIRWREERDRRAEERARQERARMVAWRILKTWLEGQLAVVQAGLVSMEAVFLPYMELETGRTLSEELEHREYRVGVTAPDRLMLGPGPT